MARLTIILHLLNKVLDNVATPCSKSNANWAKIEKPSTGSTLPKGLTVCTTRLIQSRQWLLTWNTGMASAIWGSTRLCVSLGVSSGCGNRPPAGWAVLLPF